MAEISNPRIYDLLVEISRDAAALGASIDELLLDMKAFNQELSVDRQLLKQQLYSK